MRRDSTFSSTRVVLELLEPTRLSDLGGDVDIEPAVPVPLHITAA